MPIDKPRPFVSHPELAERNLAPGEGTNPEKRVDGALFDENNQDINNALAVRQVWGVDLSDSGSTAEQAVLATPTGLLDGGQRVVVSDGTRVWLTTMHADDELRLDDSSIVNGAAGPVDYSAGPFIADLHLWTVGTTRAGVWLDKRSIVRHPDAPHTLTGADLARAPGSSTSLGEGLDSVEAAFEAEHDPLSGAHQSQFLTSAMLDRDEVFADEGFVNFIHNGSFERWPQGPRNAPRSEGWFEDGAAVERSLGQGLFGECSMKVTAASGNRGVMYVVDDPADLKGRTVTVSAWVKLVAPGAVAARIEDGVGADVGETVELGSGWRRVHCTRQISTEAEKLEVYFVSVDTGAAWLMDGVMGSLGSTELAFDESFRDRLAADDVVPVDYALNGGFEDWSAGSHAPPDQWEKHGSGNLDINRGGSGVSHSGTSCLYLGQTGEMGAGTGVVQRIGRLSVVANRLKGRRVCFSVWAKTHGATNEWRLEIHDGTTAYRTAFTASDITEWTQLCVNADLGAGPNEELELRIYSVDGESSSDSIYLDGACLNIGSRPMPGAGTSGAPSAYRPRSFTFSHGGALAGNDYVGPLLPTGLVFLPLRMDVYCGKGPKSSGPGGQAVYTLRHGSAGYAPTDKNLSATLEAVASPGAHGARASGANTPTHAQADGAMDINYLRVFQSLISVLEPPEDITVTVSGVTLA